MSQLPPPIDTDSLITEDDAPLDFLAEKQQRLLTEPLYSSWVGPGMDRSFLVAANVGLFHCVHLPALVPDLFLSLEVTTADDWWDKRHRSYFIWEFGKPPEVVIEIISTWDGKENAEKMRRYAWMGVSYYVLFDPRQLRHADLLTIYELHAGSYQPRIDTQLPAVRLGLTLWQGIFEHIQRSWLRWCDENGTVIPTGRERAEQYAEQTRQQTKQINQQTELAGNRMERLARLAPSELPAQEELEQALNLSIKVPAAHRRHWAAEAKRQGTTLTAVIIESLRVRFGEPK